MEYSQIINRILEAEQTAQAIAGEAYSREASLDEELAREGSRLRAEFQAHADERISAIAREAAASRDAAIQDQDRRRDEAMSRMERAFQHYGDNWADTLFRRIVDSRA